MTIPNDPTYNTEDMGDLSETSADETQPDLEVELDAEAEADETEIEPEAGDDDPEAPRIPRARLNEVITQRDTYKTKNDEYERLLADPAVKQAIDAARQADQEQELPEGEDLIPDLTDEDMEYMDPAQIAVYREAQRSQQFRLRQTQTANSEYAERALSEYKATLKTLTEPDKVTLTTEEDQALQTETAMLMLGAKATGRSLTVDEATRKAYLIIKPELAAKRDRKKTAAELAREAQARKAKADAAAGRVSGTGGASGTPAAPELMTKKEAADRAYREAYGE